MKKNIVEDHGCFSGINRHCKWRNQKRTYFQRQDLARDDDWLISRRFPGTVRRAEAGLEAQHSREPCAACAHTGADHNQVSGNRDISEGAEPTDVPDVRGGNIRMSARCIKFPQCS